MAFGLGIEMTHAEAELLWPVFSATQDETAESIQDNRDELDVDAMLEICIAGIHAMQRLDTLVDNQVKDLCGWDIPCRFKQSRNLPHIEAY